jgi:thiol-disulfide isomerase/thioredoxin
MRHFLAFIFIALSLQNPSVFAKDITLQTIQGDKIAFSSLKGKWVFINYWASWCHICLDEIPELNRFYRQNKDHVALFAVNYDNVSLQEQMKITHHLSYPSLKDPSQLLDLGDVEALPVTFVFNPEGKLHNTLYGGQTYKELNAYLTQK